MEQQTKKKQKKKRRKRGRGSGEGVKGKRKRKDSQVVRKRSKQKCPQGANGSYQILRYWGGQSVGFSLTLYGKPLTNVLANPI